MELAEQLRLADEPDAVPHARRFAATVVAGLGAADLVTDAELVVSELVTNAVLHGSPPIVVRITRRGDVVRIDVADGSRSTPLRARPDADTMTGRGLGLVEALADRWGVTLAPRGKTVWCELELSSGAGDDLDRLADPVDVDRFLATLGDGHDVDDDTVEPRHTVSLGDVPTDLLLRAKAHVDNLVREFTLAAAGAESGATAAVPAQLAELIEAVVHRFADARQSIKMQALEAAERGAERTHLSLTLPVSAADAGDAYLAALDEADAYARAARLLTLETPPQHRAFRRWYVESLTRQLRAIASGTVAPPPESFEQRLLAELETMATARHVAGHAARLQSVTAALSGATTVDEVTSVVVREGLEALGASSGTVLLRADGGRLLVSSAVGYAEHTLAVMRDENVDTELPGATVLRNGAPIWLESRQEVEERFPGLGEMEPRTQSLCAVPAGASGRVIGALRFSFLTPRLFDEDERRFALALAGQAAQALERGMLYAAEHDARAAAELLASRLRRLQQITADLTTAADADEVSAIVVAHASEALDAMGASVCLLEQNRTSLRISGVIGVPDELVDKYRSFPVAADLPASEAVRTNAAVVVPNRDELLRRYPLLAPARPRENSMICVPLHTGERRLGAISLQFDAGHAVGDPDEMAFLTSLADAAAQALERTRAEAVAGEAADKLTFLADASAELSASLDYRVTLTKLARLVVPRLADWCAITVVDEGSYEPVAVAHTDPAKVAFAEEVQRRYPIDPDATTGIPQIVRNGTSEIHPHITDEMLAAGATDDEHLQMIRALGIASVLMVPLTGRGGTFGVLTLVYAESGRRFTADDLAFAEEVARRSALAVENARAYQLQSGQLAAITRVAEAAQHAILAPVPRHAGPLRLAGAYVSAAREALVGGDLYEVLTVEGATRLLIGDVRGKGLDAVRLATVVLGYFRSLAGGAGSLQDAVRRIDARLAPHLDAEDFVTAMVVEIHDDGRAEVFSCGHPGPVLATAGGVEELSCPPALPLGLGSEPQPLSLTLAAGDRLLLYTDGLVEARDAEGRFADLLRIVAPLREADLDVALGHVLTELQATVGGDLGDDLALLAAEYRP